MAEILEAEMEKGAYTGVLHCFSSGLDLAKRALDIGFYISLSGIVTFKNAEALRNVVEKLPLDRILVETDAPFLAPIPNRGQRNEPSFVFIQLPSCRIKILKSTYYQWLLITSSNYLTS